MMFFKNYAVIQDSAKFLFFENGNKNGHAACLFETPKEATNAMQE